MINALKEWYNELEYFSSIPTAKFNKRSKVSSCSTKTCSIIALLFYILLVVFRLKGWFDQKFININSSVTIQPKSTFSEINKKFAQISFIAIAEQKALEFSNPSSIQNIFLDSDPVEVGKMVVSKGNLLLSAEFNQNFSLGGDITTDKFATIESSFSIKTEESRITFIPNFLNYYLNNDSPLENLNSAKSQQIFEISSEYDYSVRIKFMRVNVTRKNGILFSIGEEKKEIYNFVKDVEINQISKSKQGEINMEMIFQTDNEEMNYSVEVEELDSVLAKITAINDSFMAFLTVVLGVFNQGLYEAYIGKCCYTLTPSQENSSGIEPLESENPSEQFVRRGKKEISPSFLDSLGLYFCSSSRNPLLNKVIDLVDHEIDVVEVVKRNMYLSALRNRLGTEFPLFEEGRNLQLEDPAEQAAKENSPNEWFSNQIN